MFKELNLKDKLYSMSFEEKLELLASDGKLVKRPILVSDENVLLGFKADNYKETILK